MDPTKRAIWDLPFEQSSALGTRPIEAASDNSLSNVLRLVSPIDDLEGDMSPTRRSSAQDWSKLIDRIQHAAGHVRDVKAQAHEQDLRVQQLLDRVREDMKAAADRVRAADARVVEMQARSEALLKAADHRVKEAEDRARIAEEWLARVYDTIDSEFTIKQATK